MKVWSNEKSEAWMTVSKGVAQMNVRGLLSADQAREYCHQGPTVRLLLEADCVLVDYLDASLSQDWAPLPPQDGIHPEALCMKPGAVVVPASKEAAYRELAWLLAQRGVVKGVFTCREKARRWLMSRRQFFVEQAIQIPPSVSA